MPHGILNVNYQVAPIYIYSNYCSAYLDGGKVALPADCHVLVRTPDHLPTMKSVNTQNSSVVGRAVDPEPHVSGSRKEIFLNKNKK